MNAIISVLIAIIAGCGIFAGWMYTAIAVKQKIDEIPTPKAFLWHAGACITLKREPESWEKQIVMRIEMQGKKAYLVRIAPDSLYRDSEGFSIPYEDSYVFKEVQCPTKK